MSTETLQTLVESFPEEGKLLSTKGRPTPYLCLCIYNAMSLKSLKMFPFLHCWQSYWSLTRWHLETVGNNSSFPITIAGDKLGLSVMLKPFSLQTGRYEFKNRGYIVVLSRLDWHCSVISLILLYEFRVKTLPSSLSMKSSYNVDSSHLVISPLDGYGSPTANVESKTS